MHPSRRTLTCCWLAALVLACSADPATEADTFERQPPPADEGVYGFANGCYAVEAFDGAKTLRYLGATETGAGFAFDREALGGASKLRFRASDLGVYLLYDGERRYVAAEVGEADGSVAFTRPAQLESEVDRLDEAFRSPAEWRLQPSARDPQRYQLQHYASDRYLTLTGLTDDPAQAAIVTLQPQQGCADFPELTIDAEGRPQPKTWPDGDLFGVAEIHSHMMADSGFGGGGLYHGAPFHRLGVERALPDCSRSHGPEGRRDLIGFFTDQGGAFDLAALVPVIASGEFSTFNHATDGYPTFSAWPNSWRRATHQTMYYRWLERAYLGGLRLLVTHATGNSVMCDLTVGIGAQKTLYSCNDMVSVDRAIERAHALVRYIDAQAGGPGKGWLEVVRSPAEARAAIGAGKLAMVLGIEISNVFDCFLTPPAGFAACTPELVAAKLDHYRDLGVRVVFPVHKYDNAFSAGDGSGGIIEVGNLINSGHDSNFVQDCPQISTAFDHGDVTFGGINKPREVYDAPAPHDMSGFAQDVAVTLVPFAGALQEKPLEGDYCQKHGLTPLGEALIEQLMARAMLIDVAHLPQRSLSRTYEILSEADYPATKTHGDTNEGKIYTLGGLVGTRIDRCGDPNAAGKMGASLANDVAEAVSMGAYPAEALSFDLNGFAGGPRPRFGDDKACAAPQANPLTYPFTSFDGAVTFTQPHLGSRKVDFNTEGMIHIGLLPELLEDARRDGVSDAALEPLFRSAEAYIRMWEKAEARAAARGG
jgi:microsomal dipeptidase-like Zn-dependent dipeptidase